MKISHSIGCLLAIYFLIGRWSFDRLSDSYSSSHLLVQPRFWLALGVVILAALIRADQKPRLAIMGPNWFDTTMTAWLVYTLVTALWNPDSELALEKAYEIGILLVISTSIILTRRSLVGSQLCDGFWITLVAVGLAIGLHALFMSVAGGRVYSPTGGPNTFGRNMGLVGIGAIYLATRYGTAAQAASNLVVITTLLLVLMSGSRGALLSACVSAVVLILLARVRLSTKVVAVGSLCLVGAGVLFSTSAGSNALEVFQRRILRQTIEQRYLSGRDDIWLNAWDMTQEKPIFGWGLNGFRVENGTYPHNIVLEEFVEGGVVGVLLLALVFGTWTRYWRRIRFKIPSANVAAIALTLTSAQTSGDLYDSRGVFLLLSLTVPALGLVKKASGRPRVEPSVSQKSNAARVRARAAA